MSDAMREKVTIVSGRLRMDGLERDVAVASFTPIVSGSSESFLGEDGASGSWTCQASNPVVFAVQGPTEARSVTPPHQAEAVCVSVMEGAAWESGTSSPMPSDVTLSVERVPWPAEVVQALYSVGSR